MTDRLRPAAQNPIEALRERARNTPLGLAFSSYFPLEVLDAMGLEGASMPNRPAPDYPAAEAELQTFVCNPVRAAVDTVLSAGLPVGLIATTTGCDARLAIGSVLGARYSAPAVMLRLPVKLGSVAALRQAEAALAAFCRDAEAALGRALDPDRLAQACTQREAVRVRLTDLFEGLGERTSAMHAYAAALASQVMSPSQILELLDDPGESGAMRSGPRILLSGSSIPSLQFIADIESLGAVIAADDTCTGVRGACRRVHPRGDDLLNAIARSVLERPVHGPVLVQEPHLRAAHLASLARSRRVQAVVFCCYKFCDPHAFEIPGLRAALQRDGIPSVVVEADREPGLAARDRMRVQALLEGCA